MIIADMVPVVPTQSSDTTMTDENPMSLLVPSFSVCFLLMVVLEMNVTCV